MENNDESKRKYISPELEVMIMEMEYGIAAGSTVQPGGGSGVEVDHGKMAEVPEMVSLAMNGGINTQENKKDEK